MTFYTVGTYGHVFGNYATEELAQEACAYAQDSEELSGGFNIYGITKMEIETEALVVPKEYRKTYCKERPIREKKKNF
jgi:hypothetical protein